MRAQLKTDCKPIYATQGQEWTQFDLGARRLLNDNSRMLTEAKLQNLPRPARGVSAILAHLRRAIETGAYGEGDQLPPERQLAVAFRAARGTVRRALDQLEQAGLVSRRLGSGTFVTAKNAEDGPADDYTDLISPLQLIDARFAVEPYTTRLAVLNATRRDLDEMQAVARETPELSGKALDRAKLALASRKAPQPFDRQAARAELDALINRAGIKSA